MVSREELIGVVLLALAPAKQAPVNRVSS